MPDDVSGIFVFIPHPNPSPTDRGYYFFTSKALGNIFKKK